jgi:hypothetical protein
MQQFDAAYDVSGCTFEAPNVTCRLTAPRAAALENPKIV